MAGTEITQLPDEILAQIFKRLDVRSRIRCESVCRKFRDLATKIYASHNWKDVPNKKMTLVISAWCRWVDAIDLDFDTVGIANNTIRLTTLNRIREEDQGLKRREAWFEQLLKSILGKFISYVDVVEIHNAELNSSALRLLSSYRDRIRILKCFRCRFECAKAVDAARFFFEYGEKLVAKNRCDCMQILREENRMLREENEMLEEEEDSK